MFYRRKKDKNKKAEESQIIEERKKDKKLKVSKQPKQKVYTKATKIKKSIDWKNMVPEEIDKHYDQLKKENQELRFALVTSHVPNIRRIRKVRREIARALTYKRQKTLISKP